jgi:hypothetical protein
MIPVRQLILEYLPACVWQHKTEVVSMLEAIPEFEDINAMSVAVSLSALASEGFIEKRRMPKPIQTKNKPITVEYKSFDHRPTASPVGTAARGPRIAP